ncbi:polymer-forming cytoskeletal protein [Halorussus halophilus]|uniref:polymer-forming cytoskeletal protein n=1 Tax=Halorussus halophilus TaxID=2650975 RepID=UPI0013018FEC|nr:polymer-forming cytoskeletal protein [Halorussus halophilus]
MRRRTRTAVFAVLLAAFVSLAAIPAPVAAEQRSGGTIVVEEGETITEDLTAFGGTLIVRGTVEGDVSAFTGNVFIDGQVNGNLEAFSGNVRINGTVNGDVGAFGGNVVLADDGRIGGALETAAGNVIVDGQVGGDATIGAGTITVGPTATIDGDLTYDGELTQAEGASIGGQVSQSDDLTIGPQAPVLPGWFGFVYGLLVNLLLGAVLLLIFPTFSREVAGKASDDPLRSAGVGLLLFVAIPIALFLIALTVIGIPLSLTGILVYFLLLWLAGIYGAYSVGTWLLSLADTDNRWLALVGGVFLVAVLTQIPILGGLVQFVVLLLGFGALALNLRDRYRGRRASRRGTTATPASSTDTAR